jgi:acetylornithine deacetylase/succinyl-diaminopimelate desuccinylase-like protein
MLRIGLASLALVMAAPAAGQQAPHHVQAREIFARLISFRTAQGQGQVPAMADYIAETLRAGGVPADDIAMLPSGETTGMLVRVRGRDQASRPILFSGHMDVVDARPEDWTRNPFQLVEEGGYFFGRGTRDNKAGVAAMVSTILRMRSERFQPRRTLVFAFVGDEETTFDTTRLIARHAWARNSEYAINTDAGGGMLSEDNRPLIYSVQGAEKTYATFEIRATNPGGHSSRPRDDNAIYDLARALLRVEAYRFPVTSNSLTRSYFAAVGATLPGEAGEPLRRFAANPQDAEAAEALRTRPEFVGVTRTTCVATMLNAGHAENALPQRAVGTVNCRIFPGVSVDSVRATLTEVIANPALEVAAIGNPEVGPVSEPRPDVMAAITRNVRAVHPGVPITPTQESGATDGLIYRGAGIPTWGSSGIFMRPSDMFAHGLNERVPVTAFYQGVDHIYALAREFGGR